MLLFPNCKINIGLQVTERRNDGFHNLETIFLPLGIHDILEIIPGEHNQVLPVKYSTSGNKIEGSTADNLCIKAIKLLRRDYPQLPDLQLHLHKNIPSGAGLGGGSADAAFTLQLLNQMLGLEITTEQLATYALELGSDCPFFLKNKPAFASGRGEILEDIEVDLSQYRIVLVNPGIHVNTGWAFSQLQVPASGHVNLKEAIRQPVDTWKNNIQNDFEIPVFRQHPEIADIKMALYNAGAVYSAMSGSGSSVFGIFRDGETPVLNFPPHYFCKLV